MRALITGAAGFIGANLVRHLLRAGDEPVAVVRDGPVPWRLQGIFDHVSICHADLKDPQAVRRAVRQARPEVIFHLAAHGAYSWQRDFDEMLAVNVRATEALLEVAREIGARLVAAGSSSEYGLKDHAPVETEAVEPNSHYAVTKVCATHLCRLAAATHRQHAVTLRLYSVYGPWEQPGRLMPALVERGLAGQLPPLVAPDTARDFVWVEDACQAFVLAAMTDLPDPGTVLNVASGVQSTLKSVVDITRELFGIDAEPTWGTMDERSWDTTVWIGAPTAAGQALGWHAETPLRVGLRRFADWLQSDPAMAARYAPSAAL
jgi:nucleoside-diphosphate-sugar epimerase